MQHSENNNEKNDKITDEISTSEEEIPESKTQTQIILDEINKNTKLKKLVEEFNKEMKDYSFVDVVERFDDYQKNYQIALKERDDYLSLLQRFKADFENYKKRAQKQEESNIQFYSEKLISKIFEPIEDLSRVISFAKENDHKTIPLDGIEIIFEKISRILQDEGVAYINPAQGEFFDPRFHEALCMDDSGIHEPNSVVQNLEKGYKIKNRVIRAAKVMVASEKKEPINGENQE